MQISSYKIEDALAIYFDGKLDKTKVLKNNKITIQNEEHISVVEQPGSYYVDHFTPASGTSHDTFNGLLETFSEKNMSLLNLKAIGCDGAPVNTGKNGGVIVKMEHHLQKSLQWLVCLIHMNELPLRELITKNDGPTRGPESYSGKIGSLLKCCESSQVVNFKPINFDFVLNMDLRAKLSSDLLYLYDMSEAVQSGQVSINLASRSPGKMNIARWYTTANRILRLYVSTKKPVSLLVILVKYILQVYAPVMFNIISNPTCVAGAQHFFEIMKRSQFLPQKMRGQVNSVIQRNGYYAHSENLLLSMTDDIRENIRERAWKLIASAKTNNHQAKVRLFEIPSLNYHAKDYVDIIDLNSDNIFVPPLLNEVEINENIWKKRLSDHGFAAKIVHLPCHTQSVERTVKIVSETSKRVCGKISRNGQILTILQGRSNMKKFKSKQNFDYIDEISTKLSV